MRLELLHFWRMTRKNPAFTITVILVLAIGVGGTTAIFAIVNSVLLKPLSFRNSDEVVRISLDNPQRGARDLEFTLTRYEQIRDTAQSFSDFGAFVPENVTVSVEDQPEQVLGARISANFLHVLGVSPKLGRGFLPEENDPGAPAVAIMGDELWRRKFAARRDIIGQPVKINSALYTIVGILPAKFRFPAANTAIWITKIAQPPGMQYGTPATLPYLTGFARLKRDISLDRARAEMNTLNAAYAREHTGYLDADPAIAVRVVRMQDHVVQNVRPTLWTLFGAVVFLLLIACANVAGLMLTRAISRSHEFALRAALGAGRSMLLRQLVMESLVLALVGGLLGLILAYAGIRSVSALVAERLPRAMEIRIDAGVMLFSLALCVGTALVFGLLPWLHATRTDLATILREQRVASSASRRRIIGLNARSLLVIGQIAGAIVLLIGASLMIESFVRLRQVELGFDPANVVTMQVALPPSRYDTDRKKAAFFQQVTERVSTLPGVRQAAASASLPTQPAIQFPIQIAELPLVSASERPLGQWQGVSPGYFPSLGIRLLRGREFADRDNADAPWVVIINEKLARRFWHDYPRGPDPVGQHMLFGPRNSIHAEIVGVVADVHEASLSADSGPEAYMPMAQRCLQTMNLLVRTVGDPRRFENSIRAQILSVDPDQPVSKAMTMEEVLESSVAPQRLTLVVLILFAGVALILATVGVYGVISYSVAQRTQELGIRVALGAQSASLLWLILQQGMVLAFTGIVIGAVGALLLSSVLAKLLFHVNPRDPLSYGLIGLVFAVVAAAASYIPARRAMHIDPLTALR